MNHRWDFDQDDRLFEPDQTRTDDLPLPGQPSDRRGWTDEHPIVLAHWSRRLRKFHWIFYVAGFAGAGMAAGSSGGAARYLQVVGGVLLLASVCLGYLATRSLGRANTLREAVSVAANVPGAEESPESRRFWYWEAANWLLIIPGVYLIYRMPALAVVDLVALGVFRYLIRRRRTEWGGVLKKPGLVVPLFYAGFLLMAVARVILQAVGK